MVIATAVVSLPFVARETMPVLRELGTDAEQAAATLGASGWQTFWRVTLPAIRWGVVYGVVLTTARALGRVRRGQHRLRADRGPDADAAAVRAGPLRELRRHRRLHGRGRARAAGAGYAAGDEPAHPTHAPRDGYLMAIEVRDVSKRFGDFVALDDVCITRRRRRADGAAGAERERQVDAAADHRRARDARQRRGDHRRAGRHRHPRAQPRRRLRLPALRAVQAHDRARQRRLRAERAQAAEGGDPRAREGAARASCGSMAWPSATPRSSRADSCSAWRWRARWRCSRRCCLLDEPFGALDAQVRARAARMAAQAARGDPRDDDLRHPRPGGGDGGRRADRGHELRPDRAGGHAARALREPAQRVRDVLHRPRQPPRRRLRAPPRHPDPARSPTAAAPRRWSSASCTSASRSASSSSSTTDARSGPRSRARHAQQLELNEGQILPVRLPPPRVFAA